MSFKPSNKKPRICPIYLMGAFCLLGTFPAQANVLNISNGSEAVMDASSGVANGNYGGFSLRLDDAAFLRKYEQAGVQSRVLFPQCELSRISVRRGSGSGGGNCYMRIYSSNQPGAGTLVAISKNSQNMGSGVNARVDFDFDAVVLDSKKTYYVIFSSDNDAANHQVATARLRAAASVQNPLRSYTSGRLLNTSLQPISYGYSPLFAINAKLLSPKTLLACWSFSDQASLLLDGGLVGERLNASLQTRNSQDSLGVSGSGLNAQLGSSAVFDGNVVLNLGSAIQSKLNLIGNFSAMAWVKAEGTSSQACLLGSGQPGKNGYKLALNGNRLRFTACGVADIDVPAENFQIKAGEWFHYAVSVIGESGKRIVVFYVNAKEVYRKELANLKLSDAAFMRIGAAASSSADSANSFSEVFRGGLDELQVYNQALEGVEIEKVYLQSLQHNQAMQADADGDGMSAGFELENGLDDDNPLDALIDADLDGLINLEEFFLKSSINNPKTNGLPDSLALNLASWLPLDGSSQDKANSGNAWIFDDEVGFATYTKAVIGGGLALDAFQRPHQIIRFSENAPTTTTSADMAIALWVKVPNIGRNSASPVIIGDKDAKFAWNKGLCLGTNAQGSLYFNLGDGTNQASWQSSSAVLADNKWHHVAMVIARSQPQPVVEFYIDGAPAGSCNIANIGYAASGNRLLAGSDALNGANWPAWFDGSLDDIRCYTRKLSALEVAQLANIDMDKNGVFDRLQQQAAIDELQVAQSASLQVNANNYFKASGNWYESANDSLILADRRGWVEYELQTAQAGVWLLELNGRAVGELNQSEHLILELSINGQNLGYHGLYSLSQDSKIGTSGSVRLLTPWLTQGAHKLRVRLANVEPRRSLQIDSLKLFAPQGQDNDANNVVDWVDELLLANNKLNLLDSNCLVSPLCVEGLTRSSAQTVLKLDNNTYQLQEGVNNSWFGNLPLDANGSLQQLEVKFEDGRTQTAQISWARTNLLDASLFVEPSFKLRVGDSIRVAAWTQQSVEPHSIIWTKPDGSTQSFVLSDEQHQIIKFETPGLHSFSVTTANGVEVRSFEAISAGFGAEPVIETLTPRAWDLANIAPSLVVNHQNTLVMDELKPILSSGRRYLLSALTPTNSNVLARISERGSIIAKTRVKAFSMANSVMTQDSAVVEYRPDGSVVIKSSVVFEGELPEDFSAVITLVTAGACFADGSRSMTVTAADIDENGVLNFLYEKPPGVDTLAICHTIKIYSQGVQIN